jgi:hypothetical protein
MNETSAHHQQQQLANMYEKQLRWRKAAAAKVHHLNKFV